MFENYVGQDHIKKMLGSLIEYHKTAPEPLQHTLITGASGLGKTRIANEIANALGTNFVPLLATTATESDLIKAVCSLKDKDCLFVDECLSGDTEVLTEKGYIRLDKLTTETRVAQWDNGVIEFVYPSRIVKKYADKVYKLPINDRMTLYQTEHHRNLIINTWGNKLEVKYPKQLTKAHKLICSGKVKDAHKKLTLLEKLIIMTQADGAVNGRNRERIPVVFSIALSKQRKIKYLNTLMKADKNNTFKLREVKGKSAHGNVKTIRRWLYNLPKTNKSYKLLTNWFNLNDFDLSRAKEFLENVFVWDAGDYATGKVYCTTELTNAEFVYQVMILAGYTPHISAEIDKRGFKTHYRVYMPFKARQLSLQGHGNGINKTRKLIDWNDYMYCITVPSTFFVAKKDGYTFITGNCHSASKKFTELLLPIMAEGLLYVQYHGTMRAFRVSKFTIIGATDRPGLLNPALLNRFQLTLNLKPYTTEEFVKLIKLHTSGININDDLCIKISKLCKGVPRILINILGSIKIYLKSVHKNTLEDCDLETVKEFLGIDSLGLDHIDLTILKYLSQSKMSLKNLANICGCLSTNIENLHEPYLIQLGFIECGSGGRSITQKGLDYIRENMI